MAFLEHWLSGFDLSPEMALMAARGIFLTAAVIVAIIADFIAAKVLVGIIGKMVRKTTNNWDDVLFQRGVFNRLSHIAPLLVLYAAVAAVFPEESSLVLLIQRIFKAIMIILVIRVLDSMLSSIQDIYQRFEISKKRPIKGYLQIIKIFLFIIGTVLVVTTMLGTSPVGFLGGIGALSAVILLVFKDSILGLVASVQLSANNMIRIGDWIEMTDYGVDGDIIDVTLQTVTVRNWDMTIATVPIYALISSSFRNYRGMTESGGRRIKRALYIDMNTIKFCDKELLNQLRQFRLLKEYLTEKEQEIAAHNQSLHIDEENEYFNGRRLTNIGTFRAYISAYLHAHPMIHDDMMFLVRHLAPTDKGLPLEIYVFSAEQRWAHYENIQADIFDHLLAVLPLFDLAVYQSPGSLDLRLLAKN